MHVEQVNWAILVKLSGAIQTGHNKNVEHSLIIDDFQTMKRDLPNCAAVKCLQFWLNSWELFFRVIDCHHPLKQ